MRDLTSSVPSYNKDLYPAVFRKVNLFSKNLYLLLNETKFWTFWENLLIQSHCTANLLPLAIFFLKKAFVRKNSICFIQAPNFCTFWRFLLVQLHCSASLLTLAIFEKQFTNFLKNPFIFSNEKNLNFLYVLRNLVYSVAFYSKFAAVSGSQNSQGFHSRNQFIFSWRNQVWNVLRFLANSVAFYSKIATF